MNKKIISRIVFLLIALILSLSSFAYAATNDVTLKEAENNVCEIKLGEDGKLVKKLLSVDNDNKEATLQIDVTNLKKKAETIKPSEIFLVVDNSQSMDVNKLSDGTTTRKQAIFSAAKTLATSIINAQKDTKIGVVSFSTNSDTTKEGTLEDAKLVIKPTSTLSSITSAIDSITMAGDRTDIDAGLQVAKSNFDSTSTLNKYLILLTDGVPNTAVGGPTETYSGAVKTKTQATLKSVVDSGINIVTVMTGVNATYQPDPEGTISADARGKTYKDLAEEVFGTQASPKYGKFYFVSDDNATKTITDTVYKDTVVVSETSIKNIIVVDYFPDDIIANYDFSIVEAANIGNVTATVNTENNSITWQIEKLDAEQTASFKYKLKLKDNYNKSILNQVMPTNKKVDVTYTGTDNKNHTATSDVSPKIVLVGEDKTVAPTKIPQTGDKTRIAIIGAVILVSILSILNYRKNNKK